MFGLNSKEVMELIEAWYSKKKFELVTELVQSVKELAEDLIHQRIDDFKVILDEAKTRAEEVQATADILKNNPIDKQVATVMGAWVVQLNKNYQQHQDAMNKALEKKHDEMVLIVNNLLEKANTALDQAAKNHAEAQAYLEKVASSAAPVKNKKKVQGKKTKKG
jgi:uncharacterized protein YukE